MNELTELTMRRRFAAPVAKLYRAWCDPAQLRKWHAPTTMTTPEAEVDFRIGGKYRIVMKNPAGTSFIVFGEYLEIVENSLLRYTWQWDEGGLRTEIELRFSAHGKESELQLTHRQFPDAGSRDEHEKGWTGCLESLANFLAKEGVAA